MRSTFKPVGRMGLLLSPALLNLFAGTAPAQESPASAALDTIEVSATRLRGVADDDVPASVSTVQLGGDSNRPLVNVTEALVGIPGVIALDRQNYAQDTQLSIRGFGARSTFGVRGLRLYVDGIPASMPDGQGQLSHVNMLGADTMQVMRGPFSALYGNSSGGVVQFWSKPGAEGDPTRLRATYGSFDSSSIGAQTMGKIGLFDYNLSASEFKTDGSRAHSAAQRDSFNARIGIDVGESRTLSLIANYLDLPDAQDPLGLTTTEWQADPHAATPAALQFNTRKSVEQLQGGLVFEQRLGESQTLHAMVYGGNREVVQFLAIPVATQANPLNSGGVVDLNGNYHGGDLRWSWLGTIASRPAEFTIGANTDIQQQDRLGFENFVGTTLGVKGRLRRDEDNRVDNVDEFAQLWWQFADRWSVLAGLRHSEVQFESVDHYIVGTNPDDSGSTHYSDFTPVAGIMFHANAPLRIYASVGKGFETPTFNELAYRADGQAGLAFYLEPAVSDNYELGAKWRSGGIELDAALFRADTDNELAVARNTGGRSSYRNVAAARRQGFEGGAHIPLGHDLKLEMTYTYLDATYRSDYLICVVPGCTVPNVTVPAGARIPGVAEHQGQMKLEWTPGAWSTTLEFVAISSLNANETGTVAAPGYGLLHFEVGRNWRIASGELRGFARIENLLDRNYVGSVIVNEGNSRFYEAGPERAATVGAQWQWR
ncbi:MAG: TonB-dependent receptor [Pseudomonadota bacterium]